MYGMTELWNEDGSRDHVYPFDSLEFVIHKGTSVLRRVGASKTIEISCVSEIKFVCVCACVCAGREMMWK